MRPHFSEEGCSRRVTEENINFFQDCLHLFEDGNIIGFYQATIAWNYEDGDHEYSGVQ